MATDSKADRTSIRHVIVRYARLPFNGVARTVFVFANLLAIAI
jgi:hypothetical protein